MVWGVLVITFLGYFIMLGGNSLPSRRLFAFIQHKRQL
jgi:hypothetical protein